MADAYKTIQGYLPNAQTSIYSAPAGTGVVIKHQLFTNISGGTVTFSIWKNGTTNDFIDVNNISLDAGESYEIDDTETLPASTGTIVAIASVASAIAYKISLDETS